jgi:hypothetical protein
LAYERELFYERNLRSVISYIPKSITSAITPLSTSNE